MQYHSVCGVLNFLKLCICFLIYIFLFTSVSLTKTFDPLKQNSETPLL